jgi:hypothetical protein
MTFYPFLMLEVGSVPQLNFPQLYIVEPSSGFNKGLRSASFLFRLPIGMRSKAIL